jgi:hypothetical protein
VRQTLFFSATLVPKISRSRRLTAPRRSGEIDPPATTVDRSTSAHINRGADKTRELVSIYAARVAHL